MATYGGLTDARGDGAVRIEGAPSLAIDAHAPGAYQWWYFDATSDDGATSLVAIFFVGSVFSPWYARRLAAGERAAPREHCAVNVAVYQRGRAGWAFSEYDGFDTRPSRVGAPSLGIGRSSVARDARGWTLSLDEVEPWTRAPLRVSARFEPEGPLARVAPIALDDRGEHRWWPVAPRCRVHAKIELATRTIALDGSGYHDVNHGERPLATAFSRWTWARAHEPSGRTVIGYDRVLRDGRRKRLALVAEGARASHDDAFAPADDATSDRRGAWALDEPRAIELGSAGAIERLVRLDGSPFYARFHGQTASGGRAVAERLDVDRFARPWVRALLPFRARRSAGP